MKIWDEANESQRWATAVFGKAKLGDRRRTARLVAMATAVAERPGGTVTGVFASSAEREGAFRFLENPAVGVDALADAVMSATAQREHTHSLVYVPIDGSSLTLSDPLRRRELGRIGVHESTRGLQMMNALAVGQDGVTVGLLDQQWWARPPQKVKRRRDRKCIGNRHLKRETRFWLQALSRCQARALEHAPRTKHWYQLDRGADAWPVFAHAVERQLLITIRAAQNRRVKNNGKTSYLDHVLRRQPTLGRYALDIPARDDRPARRAAMTVRACSVTISARVGGKRRQDFTLNAVLAQEEQTRARPLRWLLLTTHPVRTFTQARAVITGYTMRWRVEEFHRAYKSGLCNVEDTQLHSQHTILKWATLLAAVAARAVRLAQLIRASPDLPASQEFSDDEIDAAFHLQKKKRDGRKTVSLRDMVLLVAETGGFAHRYSARLPGPKTIARGLERILALAQALEIVEKMR